MNQFPWLTVIGALPAVGALVLWLLPAAVAGRAKQMRFLAARGFGTNTIRRVVSGAGDDDE